MPSTARHATITEIDRTGGGGSRVQDRAHGFEYGVFQEGKAMSASTTALEHDVMTMLLAGEHPSLALLRAQFAQCSVAKREFTGVGFYTTFDVPAGTPKLGRLDSFSWGDVEATMPSLQHGVGFILWIKRGVLDFLEGYTYDELWPDHTETLALRYWHTPRDIPAFLDTDR